jgi:hypothetical protein
MKNDILSFTVQVVEDTDNPGELLLDLGTELCQQIGWNVGDTLEWHDNKDGSWTLKKQISPA